MLYSVAHTPNDPLQRKERHSPPTHEREPMTDDVQFRRFEPGDTDALLALDEWALREAGTDPEDVPGSDDLLSVSESYLDADGDFVVDRKSVV